MISEPLEAEHAAARIALCARVTEVRCPSPNLHSLAEIAKVSPNNIMSTDTMVEREAGLTKNRAQARKRTRRLKTRPGKDGRLHDQCTQKVPANDSAQFDLTVVNAPHHIDSTEKKPHKIRVAHECSAHNRSSQETNFTETDLKTALNETHQDNVKVYLTKNMCEFVFNPPHAQDEHLIENDQNHHVSLSENLDI